MNIINVQFPKILFTVHLQYNLKNIIFIKLVRVVHNALFYFIDMVYCVLCNTLMITVSTFKTTQ